MRILTNIEFDSPAWVKLKSHMAARRAEMVEMCAHDMSEADTARLRSRIKEIDYMLGLEFEPPSLEVIPDD